MPPDDFPGLGARRGVPRLAPSIDWSKLTLDGEQAFVLSRVDGRTSLGDICLVVPFPEAQTVTILRGLLTSGAIEIPGLRISAVTSVPVAAPPPRAPLAPSPPARSEPSIALSLETPVPRPRPPLSPPPPQSSSPQSSSALGIITTTPHFAPPATLTTDEPVDLPPELCKRIEEMLVIAATGNPARLLGVGPGVDKKEMRRVYFRLSKEFHPDRYYGRRLGPYKRKLQQVFAALTDALEELIGD